ncbi:TetR/AcrR family transcriptional regulator [Nostoc sp. 3335mG]|nr:TetR/AcrR family transcriptional regulator [Nostoc sp. 3335mG]
MPRGRPREFDRENALQSAMMVFWRKGYNATSIPDLCGAMGITPPSLYAAFGNKEALFKEAVRLFMTITETLLWKHLDEGSTARSALKAMLLATALEISDDSNHPTGCLISAAAIDEDMPIAVAEAIQTARRDWFAIIARHIERAAADGELPASIDVPSLSRMFFALMQGISVQVRDGVATEQLEAMIEMAFTVWPEPAMA